MNRIRSVLLLNAMLMVGTAAADPQSAPATSKDDASVQKSAALADARTNSNCVRETGSLIRLQSGQDCNGQPGRSYSREDIDRTGTTDAGGALQLLDPSVTVRR